VSSADDLAGLLDLAPGVGVEVVGLWARLGDVEVPRELGLSVAGGDLFCDGSVGSRTAALHDDYADEPGNRGALRFETEEIVAHLVEAGRAGLSTGFHVIGDAAIEQVLDAHDRARASVEPVRGSRLEHVELAAPGAVARMAALGLTASVQPAFDAEWGGPDGMYVERLGPRRASLMNPYRTMHEAGVPLLFGSDSPVCPIDPWGGVRAAVRHRTREERLGVDVAFASHSTGPLAVGAAATFAVWSHDGRRELDRTPQCLRTVVAGRTVFEAS
jgi:predicted amidohydrolase YtcJ